MNQITGTLRLPAYPLAMPASSPRPSPKPPSPRPQRDRPPARPRLEVLVAGVERDERGAIEATVRRAFGRRDPAEPWSVSLVRLGRTWSVTLRGPGERFETVSFTAEEPRLAEAIGAALGGEDRPPESGPADSPVGMPAQVSLTCERCRQSILVTYEAQPDEPKERAPLACPHCWAMNRVEIGAWAAVGGDYRAEKA